ncbi:hypothetical protein FHR92_002628 [Fontibacillus solani]|uniref:Uncharacterized protein n=1 Tax=Fontibacillus solani TaxID=1572857 RepID=A0A7W3SU12_9BACL|nr:hypothetical protein [Fontibacillus solani]
MSLLYVIFFTIHVIKITINKIFIIKILTCVGNEVSVITIIVRSELL